MPASKIKSRKPTARVPWPCILIEGEAKAGKSWAGIELTISDKVGAAYVIDLGEGAADEYGAIPGADYEVIEHDGSYAQVLDQIHAVRDEARRAADAGEPPVVLIIDQISDIWDGLKDWASERAKGSASNRRILAQDPNAEVRVSQNIWNDAGMRWGRLTTPLLTFPGIVILVARGKEVTSMDENGRPIEGTKEWRVEVRKNFEFSPTAWVRMRRGQPPLVVGARSVYVGIKPNVDEAKKVVAPEAEGRLLEWLIFDALRCDPATAHVRDLKSFHGGELTEEERAAEIAEQQSEQRQQMRGSRPAARASQPTPEQATAAILSATSIPELERSEARLGELGWLEKDVEVNGNVMTFAELVQGRRERLAESLTTKATETAVRESAGTVAREALEQHADEVAKAPVPAHTPSDVPDPEDQCKPGPARTGVLKSLHDMDVSEADLEAYFGRPIAQVATRKLTQRVKDVIAERRTVTV